MKKTIPIFLTLLLIIGGVVFYKAKTSRTAENPADFLPENVVFFLNHKDLGEIFEDFKQTSLSQAIESIDFIKIALDIEAPIEIVDKMHELKEVMSAPTTRLLVDELLSEEFTVALLPDKDTVDPVQFIEKNLLIICKPRHNVTLLELLSSNFADRFSISNSQYGKHVIHKMPVEEDRTLSFVSVGNLVIIALNERIVREGLDRYDEKESTLNDNIFYTKLLKKYVDAQLFCFFSIDNMREQLETIFASTDNVSDKLLPELDNWKGFTTGAYGAWQKEKVIEDIVTLNFNSSQLNKYTASLLSIKPEKDNRLNHVPADVLLYYWTNTFDLKTLWDMYVDQSKVANDEVKAIEEASELFLGIPVEELIALVGKKFSVMVKEPSQVDFLPIPNFTLVFELNDVEKSGSILLDILTRNEVPHNSQIYRGIEFTYWGEEIQQGLQPVYAFYENSIYFSSSVLMMKNVLNTVKDSDGIVNDEKFQLSAKTLLLENNSTGYIKFASILDVAKELVSWGGTMLALQNRQAAHKSKVLIDGLVQPLLDGLKMYSIIATRSYIEESAVIIESKTIVAD